MALVFKRTADVEAEGFDDLVFVGMGSANLAADTVARLPVGKRGNRLFVLDSTDPASIRSVEKALNLLRTLFVFASKSGKRIETHALLLYFIDRLKAAGAKSPGRHFIAVTEEDSYLAHLARTYGFRDTFLDPPGIIGRYSALIHYGLLLSTVCRIDPRIIVSRAMAVRDACACCVAPEANPALTLAALLAASAIEGNVRLLLLTSETLIPFAYQIAQTVGASTGKEGQGIVPIVGEVPGDLDVYHHGCMVAELTIGGDTAGVREAADSLVQAGVPMVRIELNGPEDLGAELFKWELATALACADLEVDPFQEPDIQDARERTSEILAALAAKHELPAATIRVHEGGIELYAEKAARQQISTLSLTEALRTFFQLRDNHGSLAILGFLDRIPERETALRRLRDQLASRLRIPVVVSFGPRYLHYLGQLYKGGPATNLFLFLTAQPDEDMAVPGADYSFGQLQLALALGDFEALGRRARPVLRLHLTQGAEQGLKQLEGIVHRALANLPSFGN